MDKKIVITGFAEYAVAIAAILGLVAYALTRDILWLQLVIIVGGSPLLIDTLLAISKRRFSVDIIAIVSIFGGLLVGQHLAAAIIVFMMAGGQALEAFAMRRATGSLQHLLQERPRTSNVIVDGEVREVPAEDLEIGDAILIRPGETVPTDCEITTGESEFNESLLTGEAQPVLHGLGSRLLAGVANITAPVHAEVLVPVAENTYSKIVELVRQSHDRKGEVQKLADRFGIWFTPLTLLFVLIVWLITKNPVLAYSVLVIATPCPLILATPIAVVAAIGRAAKIGVIVKSGSALEALARVDTVLFDKTGTLTLGQFSLVSNQSCSCIEGVDALAYAASLAHNSNHVVSRSLVSAFKQQGGKLLPVEKVQELPGRGLRGSIHSQTVLLGNALLMEESRLIFPICQAEEVASTRVFLAIDSQVVAVFDLQDTVRSESRSIIRKLREHFHIHTISMLTGDKQVVAEEMAKQIGHLTVRADLQPSDKVEIVAKLAETSRLSGKTTVMVGDGINDAAALERADVGIAIGKQGGEVAVDAADIVLLGNKLEKFPDAIHIAQRMLSVAGAGIWFGMGASLLGMVAAAAGYLPPVSGAILQEAIDAVVILNALRVLRA